LLYFFFFFWEKKKFFFFFFFFFFKWSLSIPFFGFGLIAGISFFAIHKRRQNNTEYNIEWHELIENENDNSMEDSNDNVIDIELEDETLSETYNENEILDV